MSKDSSENTAENLTEQNSQRELLIDKIRLILERSDPELWRKGGGSLDEDQRFEKPRHTWEEVYCLDIPAGTLVLRCSTPVKSEFVGRGFGLKPIADPNYSTEIRAKGWQHAELTDPFKRSRIADRTCKVLADGWIARDLFQYLDNSYQTYFRNKQVEFDQQAYDYVLKLPKKLEGEVLDTWRRSEEIPGDVHFTCFMDGYELDVSKTYLEDREEYNLVVKTRRLETKINDRGLVKEIFTCVNELGQTSRLVTLTKALEEL